MLYLENWSHENWQPGEKEDQDTRDPLLPVEKARDHLSQLKLTEEISMEALLLKRLDHFAQFNISFQIHYHHETYS